MVKRYGAPVSMEEFCDKMQLMNAIGYQGIFEAAGHKLNDIGGVMLWKLNAAFPSVVWQVYDWYLQPNAGYYFMQNACEPVHIQLNLSSHKVTLINRTYSAVNNITATVEVFDLDSKTIFKEEAYLSQPSSSVKETTSLAAVLEKSNGLVFVVLNLKDPEGKVISHNVYWLSNTTDYKELYKLPETHLVVKVLGEKKGQSEKSWSISVTNSSGKMAFFIRPQLMVNGAELLPSFWSANYFSLAPGESTEVTVSCPMKELASGNPVLKVSGWNIKEEEYLLAK